MCHCMSLELNECNTYMYMYINLHYMLSQHIELFNLLSQHAIHPFIKFLDDVL